MDLTTRGYSNMLIHMHLHPMQGIFCMPIKLSEASIQELLWWITYALQTKKHILSHSTPSMIIQSNASKKGWGEQYLMEGGPHLRL